MSSLFGMLVLSQLSLFLPKTFGYFIPGSKLKVGVCYTIGTKNLNPGYVTWTTQPKLFPSQRVQWYLHHVYKLNHETAAKYRKGGEWYESTLWQFIPSNKYPGWYKLRNGRFPYSYVTWSLTDAVPWQYINTSLYVILERGRDEADYMLKPVFAEKSKRGSTEYHQLAMRNFPNGKISWTREARSYYSYRDPYVDYSIDNVKRYDKGGSRYTDSLFIFKEMEGNMKNGENYDLCHSSGDIQRKVTVFTKLLLGISLLGCIALNFKASF